MAGNPSRAGAVAAALAWIALGVLLTLAGFALSDAVGTATTVIAIGPFVLAARIAWRAFRDRLWALAVGGACALAIVAALALMAPYMERWDPTGAALVSHAERLPEEATGRFDLPRGDPGIPGIYAAFVDASGSFSRADGDDDLWLVLVEGRTTGTSYVATEVARVETRHRMPWEGTQYVRVIGRCSGSATFSGGAWTLSFTDAACARANGRYPRAAAPR